MRDGIENIRYLLLDMTHPSYTGLINRFTQLHANKEAGNTLTVLPNVANTQAVVKVVAHVGWIQEENLNVPAILEIHPYEEINIIHDYLRSTDWPEE